MDEVISRQSSARPHAPAICAWDGSLTYQELDERSTALAQKLILHGVELECLVPLLFEKSKWTPVAMLGVLKSGAAFVLLELNWPLSRLRSAIQQLGSPLILSSKANAELSSRLIPTVQIVDEETPRQDVTLNGTFGTQKARASSTAAFALFTSGSAGVPKCIVTTHSQFASNLFYQSQILGFTQDSRVFDFASYVLSLIHI